MATNQKMDLKVREMAKAWETFNLSALARSFIRFVYFQCEIIYVKHTNSLCLCIFFKVR